LRQTTPPPTHPHGAPGGGGTGGGGGDDNADGAIGGNNILNPNDFRNFTPKQREQFKNLMKDAKEAFLEETAAEELNTIAAVSENVRDSFKTLIEDQEAKNVSLEKKLTDLAAKTQAITLNSGGPSGMASITNDLKMELNFVKETVNNTVKQEISTLHKTLLEALKSAQAPPPAEPITIRLQNRDVPLTWNPTIKPETITKALQEFKPFKEWMDNINRPTNSPYITVNSVNIQSIDYFGHSRIGFMKLQATAVNEAGKFVAGIVFLRGPAVGMLVILKLNQPGSPDHGKEFTIVTIQPRIPIGEARFAEIPAGMLDDGQFAGVAAKELKEETGIDIQEDELIDLSGLAYNGKYPGMYPSAGGCDEVLRLFCYRTTVTKEQLDSYQNKLTGVVEEGESISLKVIPLEDLWLEAPDAKALSAMYLYNMLTVKGLIPAEY